MPGGGDPKAPVGQGDLCAKPQDVVLAGQQTLRLRPLPVGTARAESGGRGTGRPVWLQEGDGQTRRPRPPHTDRQTDLLGREDDGKDGSTASEGAEKLPDVPRRSDDRPWPTRALYARFPGKGSILHARSRGRGNRPVLRAPRDPAASRQPLLTPDTSRVAPEGRGLVWALQGTRLTAAVGSLCVQATGSRSFQSVSPSSWSVRRKQDPVEGSGAPSSHLRLQKPSLGSSCSGPCKKSQSMANDPKGR